MSRSISALPRFTLLTALAVTVGSLFAEAVVRGFVGFLYNHLGLSAEVVDLADFSVVGVVLTTLAKIIACVLVVALVLRRSRESWRALGHAGFAPITLGAAFVPVIAGIVIFLSEIDNLMRAVLPPGAGSSLNWAPSLGSMLTAWWAGPLLAIVVGPVTEEIIFRGVILRGLLGRYGPRTAVVISALIFAVMHVNPAQFPIAFGLGLILGWVYLRTRSLGLCLIGHALNNSSIYLTDGLPFQIDGFNRVPEEIAGAVFQPWWFDLTGLALFAGGLLLIHRLAPAAAPWQLPPEPPPPVPPLLDPPVLAPARDANDICQTADRADTSTAMSAELTTLVTSLAQRARAASLALATVPTAAKNAALLQLADLLDASHAPLLAANALDLASPEAAALSPAARARLELTEKNLAQLAQSVREVAALPDPVGTVLDDTTRPNGLRIRKVRVPIGVIGIIYESRPNVTVDCAILCLKSGNACILRGGKECFHTNTALANLIQQAIAESPLSALSPQLSAGCVQLVPTTDRAALTALLKLDTLIHCIIPRGGEGLIRFVAENSTIPVIKHYQGVCFVYVDAAADLAMAEAITVNAKASRPSACNSAEQLLVHRDVAEMFLPSVARALAAKNVSLRCDPASLAILTNQLSAQSPDPSTFNLQLSTAVAPATASDYTTEFLDYVIAIRVVDSLDAAIATINRDSSNHSDAIVTADESAAKKFLAEIDSATVFWNASTRFNDGFEFGFGAEIGISTDRLHARGPMGLPELCSYKYLIEGTGQVRS